jgi:hypothetical protein
MNMVLKRIEARARFAVLALRVRVLRFKKERGYGDLPLDEVTSFECQIEDAVQEMAAIAVAYGLSAECLTSIDDLDPERYMLRGYCREYHDLYFDEPWQLPA